MENNIFKLDFINYGINNNLYFNKNIKKFLNVKENVCHLYYSNNINNYLYENLSVNTLFAIHFTKNPDFNKKLLDIPIYPIIYFNKMNNGFTLIISSILLQQIRLLPIKSQNKLESIINNIKNYIGGLLTNNKNNIPKFNKKIYNGYIYVNNIDEILKNNNNINKIINKNIVQYFEICDHGWLGESTKLNLKYIIENFHPNTIVELGSWYGLSSKYIMDLSKDTSNIFYFDKFQNIIETPYKIDKYSPLDKFYFSYPRYESFYKKLATNRKGNAYMIKGNADYAINYLKKNNIKVDLFFIDFIKKKDKLIKYLENIIKYYPESIIVGDDYIFKTVKDAISIFIKKYPKLYYGLLPESYIISPYILKNYESIQKIIKESNKKNELIKKGINLKNSDKYKYAKILLENNKIIKAYKYIYKNKLNMNDPILSNNNTLYNILSKTLKNNYLNLNKKNNIFNIFKKYQSPKLIENILKLTWEDYYNHYINFE